MMNGDTETPVHNNIKDDNEAVAENKTTATLATTTTMDQQEATKCDSTSVDINDVKRNLEFENVREISKGDKQDFILFLLVWMRVIYFGILEYSARISWVLMNGGHLGLGPLAAFLTLFIL